MEDIPSQKRERAIFWFIWIAVCLAFLFALLGLNNAHGAEYPEKLNKGFILDTTGRFNDSLMFSTLQGKSIRLAVDHNIKIHTLIIASVEDMGRYILGNYSDDLFDAWDLGDDGMLLVIDCQNENAHITLGSNWDTSDTDQAAQIVERLVVPCLREGAVLEGVQYGINGLESIYSGTDLPKRYRWWNHPFFLKSVLPALFLGNLMNFIFRYRHSWFWIIVPYMGAFFFAVEWAMENGQMHGGGFRGYGCGGCCGCGGCAGCGGCGGA